MMWSPTTYEWWTNTVGLLPEGFDQSSVNIVLYLVVVLEETPILYLAF